MATKLVTLDTVLQRLNAGATGVVDATPASLQASDFLVMSPNAVTPESVLTPSRLANQTISLSQLRDAALTAPAASFDAPNGIPLLDAAGKLKLTEVPSLPPSQLSGGDALAANPNIPVSPAPQFNAPNGIPLLDTTGKLPSSLIPALGAGKLKDFIDGRAFTVFVENGTFNANGVLTPQSSVTVPLSSVLGSRFTVASIDGNPDKTIAYSWNTFGYRNVFGRILYRFSFVMPAAKVRVFASIRGVLETTIKNSYTQWRPRGAVTFFLHTTTSYYAQVVSVVGATLVSPQISAHANNGVGVTNIYRVFDPIAGGMLFMEFSGTTGATVTVDIETLMMVSLYPYNGSINVNGALYGAGAQQVTFNIYLPSVNELFAGVVA